MKCVNGNVRLNPVVIRTTFFGAKAPSFFNLEINLCSDENHFTFPTDNSDNNIDPKTTTSFYVKTNNFILPERPFAFQAVVDRRH